MPATYIPSNDMSHKAAYLGFLGTAMSTPGRGGICLWQTLPAVEEKVSEVVGFGLTGLCEVLDLVKPVIISCILVHWGFSSGFGGDLAILEGVLVIGDASLAKEFSH